MTTTGKIVQKQETLVDPNFFTPPNVVDIRNSNDEDARLQRDELSPDSNDPNSPTDDGANYIVIEVPDDFDGTATISSAGGASNLKTNLSLSLPIPSSMAVVEQIFNFSPDGTGSVDVVLFTPDLIGVTEVDVRITKVGS